MIETPYLLFLGDAPDPLAAKVAQGIRDWRPDAAIGQYRMAGCNADMGLPDMTHRRGRRRRGEDAGRRRRQPRRGDLARLDRRADRGAGARHGPRLGPAQPLARRARARRRRHGARAAACTTCGCRRTATPSPTASGGAAGAASRSGPTARWARCTPRSAMEQEMHARGMAATFRATGQTGILITGGGVPLDAVVADFMAGAIEWLTPDNEPGPLGPDRGAGEPLPPLLLRRDAGARPRRPARRAGPLPRADAGAHARAAGLRGCPRSRRCATSRSPWRGW